MSLNPIAVREALEISRRARTFQTRVIAAGFGLFGVLIGLWLGSESGGEAQGQAIFVAVSILAQTYALLAGVIVSGDAIASERRENTLGLLFLTVLRPRDVLAGKLMANSTLAVFGLIAFLPLLAVPILLGGVSIGFVLKMALALVVTLGFSIGVGFVLSSVLREGWAAIALGAVIMLALGLFYPLGALWFFWSNAESIIFPSPTASVIMLLDPKLLPERVYWQSVIFAASAGAACFAITALRLVYIWRDPALTGAEERRRARLATMRFGNRRGRRWLREKLLDQSPLAWLANREFVSSPWLTALLLAGLLSQFAVWTMQFTDTLTIEDLNVITSLVLFAMHVVLFFRICVAAAHPVAEDRKSGALELLLSAPLAESEIVKGRWLGLARRFLVPVLLLLIAEAAFVAVSYGQLSRLERIEFFENFSELELTEKQNTVLEEIVIVLLAMANWIAAGWLGMWWGLRMKTPGGAVWATFATVALPPMLLVGGFFAVAALLGITNDFSGDFLFTIAIVSMHLAGLTNAAILMHGARKNLLNHLRIAAADQSFSVGRIVPWSAIRRLSAATAVALALGGAVFWMWREQANRRGERIWTSAIAAHPLEGLRSTNVSGAAANLAHSPLLARYIDPVVAQRAGPISPSGRWIDFHGGRLQTTWETSRYLDTNQYHLFGQVNRAQIPGAAELESFLAQLSIEAERFPSARFKPEQRQRLLNLASVITIASIHQLRAGGNSVDEPLLILRLAEGFVDKSEFLNRFLQIIFEGAGQHRWDASELLELDNAIGSLDLWRDHQTKIFGETREAMELVATEFKDWGARGSAYTRMLGALAPKGWLFEEQADMLRATLGQFPKMFDAANRRIDVKESFAMRDLRARVPRFVPYRLREQILWSTHGFSRTQVGLDQARIALALEGHRLKQGGYPKRLPEGLPHDLFTGQPINYRPAENGESYVLYSVGWDGRDDGGAIAQAKDVSAHRMEPPGDWVWNPFTREARP